MMARGSVSQHSFARLLGTFDMTGVFSFKGW